MSLRIFVVSCVIVDRVISPGEPMVFTSMEDAAGYLREEMKKHWEVQKEQDERLMDCPEDWKVAQHLLAKMHTDGSWGWYTLTIHNVNPCAIHAPPLALQMAG